ncbi:MAG: CBS domain-containing protein, partial [Deltaproteobacteria bacterium]
MDLATSHLGTDLDGLAALAAIALLEGPLELGVPGSLDPVTTRFYKDHGAGLVDLVPERDLRERLAAEDLGRLVVVDTARAERLGFIAEHLDRFTSVVAWDTHDDPAADLPRAAHEPAAAVVSSLVLLIAERGLTPTPAQAGLFLLGIHADTGHFVFPGTTPNDYRAAALCAAWGAPVAWVEEYVPRGLDRHRLRLVERMAKRVTTLTIDSHAVAICVLDLDDYEPDLAPLLDTLRRAERWEAAFLIAADPRRTVVIGRSSGGVDVAAALRPLGGGGHPEAASASLRACPIPEAHALLVDALEGGAHPLEARNLASPLVYNAAADGSIDDAAAALHKYKINAIPLVRDGAYVGLVSRREVDDAVRHGMGRAAAASISSGPPAWVPPEATVADVRRVMLETPGRLVLVGEPPGPARGVVTRTAVFRASVHETPFDRARPVPRRETMLRAMDHALSDGDRELIDRLGRLADDSGLELYLVGGAVRDVLLRRPVEDLDLVVVGDAPTLGRAAAERHGGRLHVHEAFGTCTWTTPNGRKVDLTTARTESYPHPAALPDVASGGLHHDLLRRDFTINAMALAVGPARGGQLVDPFGGQLDLDQRMVRVLHGLSFHDDPTRAFRAARFAGRFDFTLAPGSQALLREALRASFAERLGPARLGAELHKVLCESQVVRCVAMLREWGLLALVHPRLPGDRELLERVSRVREAWLRHREWVSDDDLDGGEPQWVALGWSLPTDDRRDLSRLTARVRGRTARWVGGPVRVRGALDRI